MNEIVGAILLTLFITSCVALLLMSFRFSQLTKYAILAITGTVMIAQGSRIITQTILYPGSVYRPGFFDLVFDWFTLVLLGVFIAWFGFLQFYRENRQHHQEKNQSTVLEGGFKKKR